ncbi:hypothetical protein H0E87_029446 [Populus deltoides]|uniref:Uncharacterized protein n=1 Tax=Populus deltoides TaxID=3696 RepID=A0A8T2WMA9_POPDE|nr:hypothetical protein H0E87_029446 [Populus deltoides]
MKLQFHTQFIRITLIVLQLINPSLQWPEPEYSATPIPAPWPEQFHALLYMNLSSTRLQITNLWPDFLDGAEHLGTAVTDGYLCNVWEKIDIVWYYEDVYTKRPVR